MARNSSELSKLETHSKISRRRVLASAGVAGLLLPVATLKGAAAEEEHHHHGGAKYQSLIDAGLLCVSRGEVCAAHCIDLLGKGERELADCLASVSAMLPMCAMLARYAALDAPRLKELAKVCIDVCDDCATACDKHAKKHEVCKACKEFVRSLHQGMQGAARSMRTLLVRDFGHGRG